MKVHSSIIGFRKMGWGNFVMLDCVADVGNVRFVKMMVELYTFVCIHCWSFG